MDIKCEACAQCGAKSGDTPIHPFPIGQSEIFPLCRSCADRACMAWPASTEAEPNSVSEISLDAILVDLGELALHAGVALDEVANRVPLTSETDTDALVDHAITIDELADAYEALAKRLKERKDAVAKRLADRFIEAGTQSVTRNGKTLYLAREYWPGPAHKDLLPPGVDESNPDYAATVEQCRAAAKDRLVQALKASANYSHLIQETFNYQSLRGAFAGADAPRDDLDAPIVPPEFEKILSLNPRDVVRLRAATVKRRR